MRGARAANRVAVKMPEKQAFASASLAAGSLTATNLHGCPFSPEGARRAASTIDRMSASATARSS